MLFSACRLPLSLIHIFYPAASLVRCVRPGIPIYVVDPGNPDTAGIRNPLTLIRKRAAEGMPGLAELLREKYAAG